MRKILFTILFIGASFSASASKEEVCNEAASSINDVIEDWHSFVKKYGAEGINPGVLAMYRDYKSGTLKAKFEKDCMESLDIHSSVYECFSGVRSELGAAMCMHPDTNTSNWTYK